MRSRSASRGTASGPGCTSRTFRRTSRPGSPLDRDAAERAFSVYVPGRVEPMLPDALSSDLCSLRPGLDRRCVTVEAMFDGSLQLVGEPLVYRSLIRSRERLTYGQAQRILAGEERAEEELTGGLRLAERVTTALRERRFARGALRIEKGEVSFVFDGKGGVERAWIEQEPLAHMLVEELMILANEVVARLLSSRKRDALYRVHERPDPQAVELLLAKLTDLEIPTPPVPEHLSPRDAARLAAEIADGIADYAEKAGRGREAFPDARPPGPEAGALRPEEPRALRPREPRLLPLHVADPPVSRPGRSPRAPSGAGRRLRLGLRPICRSSPSGRPSGSARPRRSSTRRMRSASPGTSSGGSSRPAGRHRFQARSRVRSHRGSSSASTACSRATFRPGGCRAITTS